jgi:integrase
MLDRAHDDPDKTRRRLVNPLARFAPERDDRWLSIVSEGDDGPVYVAHNPALLAGRNPQPSPRPVRAFTSAELDAIAEELSAMYRPLPLFAAATGLRPEEWAALGRAEVDRGARVLTVARTLSGGQIVELGKTSGSLRQVPLSRRALDALDALPPRLDTPLLFPAKRGGPLNLDNWRRREWGPAIEAAGVRRPARIYDLRATFISNALAAGVSIFEIARIAGTSVRMIEKPLRGAPRRCRGRYREPP